MNVKKPMVTPTYRKVYEQPVNTKYTGKKGYLKPKKRITKHPQENM